MRQAIHGGFRSVAIPELAVSRCYPSRHLAVKYRRDESAANYDIEVSGGNILAARKLHSRPKISYGDGDGYFTLLLLDIDFPSRMAQAQAAETGGEGSSCVNWALLNICKSDRAAMKEVTVAVAAALPGLP